MTSETALPEHPATARRQRVREVDFRRPTKFSRGQIRQLERVHEAFCAAASSRLSAELREEITLASTGTDQLPYAVIMVEDSPRDALVAILDVEPLGTQVALVLEMPTAHALVNRLLGGVDEREEVPDSLTELELAVVDCALASLVDTLSAAWTELFGLKVSVSALETSPMAVELVPPSEPCLLLTMSVGTGPLEARGMLVLPHPALADVLPSLDRNAFAGHDEGGDRAAGMRRAVGGVDVELRAELGSVSLPASRVLNLKPGDTVRLGVPSERGARLCVDDVVVHAVQPGRNGAARAVRVTGGTR